MPNQPGSPATTSPLEPALDVAWGRTVQTLLDHRSHRGAIRSELSSSALSTAVASMALGLEARESGDGTTKRLAEEGHAWLCANQNEDGGWGDTRESPANISTTTLGLASLQFSSTDEARRARDRAEGWIADACGGSMTTETLVETIRGRYGKDRTFSVPILTTCTLAGLFGGEPGSGSAAAWRHVMPLPFELAACPQGWFKALNLRVVSYALPALIAIGQARHHHRPTWNPLTRIARGLTRRRTLRVLREIQPGSGGYLEAAPLTSFVAMSLISMGMRDHPVVVDGLRFLRETVRPDGSWPIDTNLDTWVTSLTVQALGRESWSRESGQQTRQWLLDQQYLEEHPFTRAAPGGWAWTDLSGGVPDADDTPGALLAVLELSSPMDEAAVHAATAGLTWLADLQNRDGGIPTFCRGWGKLPFDRSSPDLTAHTLRAIQGWLNTGADLPEALARRLQTTRQRGVRFLCKVQRIDGAWIPLWFGNQQEVRQENPLYGTSRVLRALLPLTPEELPAEAGLWEDAVRATRRGTAWLLDAQHPEGPEHGGFGGTLSLLPTLEETALAVETLAEWAELAVTRPNSIAAAVAPPGTATLSRTVELGTTWLLRATDQGQRFPAAPIGLYFAKLWYREARYPEIFAAAAFRQVRRWLDRRTN